MLVKPGSKSREQAPSYRESVRPQAASHMRWWLAFNRKCCLVGASLLATLGLVVPAMAEAPKAPPTWREVAPLFNAYCVRCHRDDGEMGEAPEGFVLLSHEEATDTSKRARIVPGRQEASELLRRVRGQSWIRMPLDGPPWLSAEQEQLLSEWIAGGARDAKGRPMAEPVGAALQLGGKLTALWAIDGVVLVVGPQTVIERSPKVGDLVDVRGTLGPKGEILVTLLRRP